MYGMPHSDLHPQLIIPDRILFPADHKPDTARAILPPHKIRVFLRCLLNHEIIDDPQMASVFVAAFS